MTFRVLHGDCLEHLVQLAADGVRVHAVVTDPPYGLGFMGKAWDARENVAFRPETWRRVFDCMLPGAALLAFGGSRSSHRMTCAIEDAGFEIRDTLMWVYGSGFPKSHDVAKAIDNRLGLEGKRVAAGASVKRMVPGADQNAGGWIKDGERSYQPHDYKPGSAAAAAWDGWGTALKPAVEPIVLARRPLDGTVAGNVLRHGCGGLNIGACRVQHASSADLAASLAKNPGRSDLVTSNVYGSGRPQQRVDQSGRFPANLLHDGSDEVEAAFAAFGQRKPGSHPAFRAGLGSSRTMPSTSEGTSGVRRATEAGSASRFFYSAKAGKADRAGSAHPTVKPTSLMEWLVQLVTPPGGTVLDPFAGTGSTGLAASRHGLCSILIEQDAAFVADMRRKIGAHLPGI